MSSLCAMDDELFLNDFAKSLALGSSIMGQSDVNVSMSASCAMYAESILSKMTLTDKFRQFETFLSSKSLNDNLIR